MNKKSRPSLPRLVIAVGWFSKRGATRAALVLDAEHLKRGAQALASVAISALLYCPG